MNRCFNRKAPWLVLILFGSGLMMTSCGGPKEPIRIGVNDWPPCEIWYEAQEQGFFGDTEVELIRYSTWIDNMSNFFKGNSDISHATYFNALYFYGKGEPGKIILTSDTVLGSDGLVVRSGIDLPHGLRGKRIAVEVHTDEQFLLSKALESLGLDEDDVRIVPATSKGAMELFIRGDVEGCATYNPYLEEAAREGDGTVVWTTADAPGYMEDVLVAGDGVLKHRKKDLEVILAAWFKARDYIRTHPEESYTMMGENEGMGPEIFGPFFESFTFYSPRENLEIFRSPGFTRRMEEMAGYLLDHGMTETTIPVGDVYTIDILEALEKQR